ncbi:MAG: HPr family phosphocarrier protein [Clostridiales bacterium]|nr:HPr family phosphocarrier protein [Clostridiales bacterium]
MVSQTVVLNMGSDGFSTKVASQIIHYLRNFESTVIMKHDGRIANCKSLISLINLGAEPNSLVEVMAEGRNEARELADFVKFLENFSVE